ncbi:hypothetical protein F4803DRAFT_572530 [Xylaria telfairii]|nr:hypothetical protein F4803DRAFT_572530 [Xylaria telfairii]
MHHLRQFPGHCSARMAASLSALMNPTFLSTRLRAEDPMNPSDWYLLRDRVDEIFDLLAQMIDHQEDINSGNGLGKLVSFSPWKHHVGWAFADVASPGEPFTPDPCTRCLWKSLAPKGEDILAVSLDDLKLHSESNDRRRLEVKYILRQRLSEDSCDSCFRACSRGNCANQRIHTFHKISGKGYDPSWGEAGLHRLEEDSTSINGAALLGVRFRALRKWRDTGRNRDQRHEDQHQPETNFDGLGVVYGVPKSISQNSSGGSSQDSILTPSTPGSSVLLSQSDSLATTDEGTKTTSQQVRRGRTPFRMIQGGTNNWVHKLKSPQR